MKARVKATGKVVEVNCSRQMGPDAVYIDLVTGETYMDFELSLLPEDGTPDYWIRLEHQYAGMAMQGLMSKEYLDNPDSLVSHAIHYAHALVERLKKKEE